MNVITIKYFYWLYHAFTSNLASRFLSIILPLVAANAVGIIQRINNAVVKIGAAILNPVLIFLNAFGSYMIATSVDNGQMRWSKYLRINNLIPSAALNCPTETVNYTDEDGKHNYGLSYWTLGYNAAGGATGNNLPVKRSVMLNKKAGPKTICSGDSRPTKDNNGGDYPYGSNAGTYMITRPDTDNGQHAYPIPEYGYASPYLRHNLRANFVFFDGHSGSLDRYQVEKRIYWSPRYNSSSGTPDYRAYGKWGGGYDE